MIRIKGKIPITIYPFFWVVAIFIGFINSPARGIFSETVVWTGIWTGIIFFSVLVHEFGHALTARAFGHKAHIDLIGFGGLTHRHGKKLSLWKEFLITLNGPLAGFLLVIGAYLVWATQRSQETLFSQILYIVIGANIFWTIVNLFPIAPLDGGKLLGIVLEAVFGINGFRASLLIGIIFAALISMLFFIARQFLAGSLFLILMFESFKLWQESLKVTSLDKDEEVQIKFREAEKSLQKGDHENAFQHFQLLRNSTKKGVIYLSCTLRQAQILRDQGRLEEAYQLLETDKSQLDGEGVRLLHRLAYQTSHWASAISVGDQSYQDSPSYESALINAMCYALLGQERPAIGWLKRALSDGLPNKRAILSKSEFDNIRQSSSFRNLLEERYDT